MMVQTSCPACGKTGKVPAVYLGRTVGCKRCSVLFKVRAAAASSRPAEPIRVNFADVPEVNAWLDDMPPVMVDMPSQELADERVPA